MSETNIIMVSDILPGVKYLLFDVFGTVVDYRTSIARQLHEQCQKTISQAKSDSAVFEKARSMDLDQWHKFTAQWLQGHSDLTWDIANAVLAGREPPPFRTIDEYHAESLPGLIQEWGLAGLWDEDMTFKMSRVLHSLDAWPDSAEGIKALNALGYQTITLSNGNRELMADTATYAGLEWTYILSAADFRTYKPVPRVYTGAAEELGVKPEECALVAAHMYDLEAARKCGYKCVYVERPGEEKWKAEQIEAARSWVDVWVTKDENGLIDAAEKLR